jgi:hypothetical protein
MSANKEHGHGRHHHRQHACRADEPCGCGCGPECGCHGGKPRGCGCGDREDSGRCQCGAGSCQCGEGSCQCHANGFRRRFQTKAELVATLEAYLTELRAELQAVEEKLAELR